MRIIPKDYSEQFDVYAIYWIRGIKHFLFIPYDGYTGLRAVLADDCQIIEDSIELFVSTKSADGDDVLVHADAYSDDLLGRLIDHDPDAMIEFKRRLAERENGHA